MSGLKYKVFIEINPSREKEWLDYMLGTGNPEICHIHNVLDTQCFYDVTLTKHSLLENFNPKAENSGAEVVPAQDYSRYSIIYTAKSEQHLQTYLEQFAPTLQEDHTSRFAGAFKGKREITYDTFTMTVHSDAYGNEVPLVPNLDIFIP